MKKNKFVIGVDVDEVCADLKTEWLRRYNMDYNDSLTSEDVTEWEISKFVKPECGAKMFDYIGDSHIYDVVKPIEGALEGIQALRHCGHRIVFITSSPVTAFGRKWYWLKDNGFAPERNGYIEALDKSLILADYLLDDRYDNVKDFSGSGVLYTCAWNKKYNWSTRVSNWKQFVDKIAEDALICW